MGLKEMQIYFDNPYAAYNVGATVTGQLMLRLDASKKVKDISIKFKGEANVEWSETESFTNAEGKSENRTVYYTSHEKYFENKFVVFGGAGNTVEIPPGTHTYPFQTILPPSLPSSFEGEYGHVRYTVKATLNRPWKFDQECKAAFTVISPVDLNYHPEARNPIAKHDEKYVGSCCCRSGPLSASINIPASGFVSGQVVPLGIEIENLTNTSVTSAVCYLRKVVTYKAVRPSQRTKVLKTKITEVRLSSALIGAHSSNRWEEKLNIPALPPSNLQYCSIIDLYYEIKLETKVDGMCLRGLNVHIPVIIGTIPLAQFVNYLPPPTAPQQIDVQPMAPGIGWGQMPPGPPDAGKNPYPDMPPPSYEESVFGKANTIKDPDDNEHTIGVGGWAPRYPTYNFAPSAPVQG